MPVGRDYQRVFIGGRMPERQSFFPNLETLALQRASINTVPHFHSLSTPRPISILSGRSAAMFRHVLFAVVACALFSACGRSAVDPARRQAANGQGSNSTTNSEPTTLPNDFVVSKPVQHGNLMIFPVLSRSIRAEDRFITLDEGLKAGTVEILEMGARAHVYPKLDNDLQAALSRADDDQAEVENDAAEQEPAYDDSFFVDNDVNHLMVINSSGKPLYLMPGEIIVGGSQDRTIGEEMVIAATGKPEPIEVYCVEHGRWGARDLTAASLVIGEMADESEDAEVLASVANSGKFVGKVGSLNKSSRVAVQAGEGQARVWDEVAKANAASGVSWSSGAFTANYVDKNVLERLQPYQEALNLPVSKLERVVGVVVAINGKIETADVFESTPLFLKLWPQLLKSYALDAIQVATAENAEKQSTSSEAEEFLASILRDQDAAGSRKTDGGLVVSRHETNDHIGFSAGAMGGMGGGMMGGGFGGPIHSSGFSK
jgi:hypothetical protein